MDDPYPAVSALHGVRPHTARNKHQSDRSAASRPRDVRGGGVDDAVVGGHDALCQSPYDQMQGAAGLRTQERDRRLMRALTHDVIPEMLMRHMADPAARALPDVDPQMLERTPGVGGMAVTSVNGSGGALLLPADGGSHYSGVPDATFITEMLHIVLRGETAEAQRMLQGQLRAGVGFEPLLTHVLTPVARLAGEYWATDRCSFLQVSLAVTCLSSMVRRLEVSLGKARPVPVKSAGRHCLLLSREWDTHTFGLQVLTSLLRDHGWCVTSIGRVSLKMAVKYASEQQYAFVGVSFSSETTSEEASQWSQALRYAGSSPDRPILAGGPGLDPLADTLDPDLFDFVSSHGMDTVRYADAVWRRQAGEALAGAGV